MEKVTLTSLHSNHAVTMKESAIQPEAAHKDKRKKRLNFIAETGCYQCREGTLTSSINRGHKYIPILQGADRS